MTLASPGRDNHCHRAKAPWTEIDVVSPHARHHPATGRGSTCSPRGAANPVRGRARNRRGDPLPALRRGVRFGATVYGFFLAAFVVGVAHESGAGARKITASLLGGLLGGKICRDCGTQALTFAFMCGSGDLAFGRRPN